MSGFQGLAKAACALGVAASLAGCLGVVAWGPYVRGSDQDSFAAPILDRVRLREEEPVAAEAIREHLLARFPVGTPSKEVEDHLWDNEFVCHGAGRYAVCIFSYVSYAYTRNLFGETKVGEGRKHAVVHMRVSDDDRVERLDVFAGNAHVRTRAKPSG